MAVLEILRVGGTAMLTLNRPERRNALDDELRDALADALPVLREDPTVRAVVITGAGEHFCAGGDVKGMGETLQSSDGFTTRARMKSLQRCFDALVDLEKPVIAAVDGVAYGAGLSLALTADFVLASPRATFCSVFARLGFVPDAGAMYMLPRAVGLAAAKDMIFSARVVEAQEALAMGLVHKVCEGDVKQAALKFAERFQNAPTVALGLAKGILNRAFESERREVFEQEALAQSLCRQSDYHKEALRRFLAKEKPLYP